MARVARVPTFISIFIISAHAAHLRSLPTNANASTSQLTPKDGNMSTSPLHDGPNDHANSVFFTAQQTGAPVTDAPQMFVAVMTTRATPTAKRQAVRDLWREVDGGSGHICARFVVCEGQDNHGPALWAEHQTNGDMLFLPCQEGYAKGLLTKKVIATMKQFRQAETTHDICLDRPLIMKMDDDTFVAGHRFRQGFAAAVGQFGTDFMYAGVDLPPQPPNRNPQDTWYEPHETWPEANFPPAMYGGPGYILGRGLVRRMADEGIMDSHILYNEDRAAGVWVNVLQQQGQPVHWIRIPGSNGFHWDWPVKTGTWGAYPYTLHHHLSKASISCLTALDLQNNPTATIDHCF